MESGAISGRIVEDTFVCVSVKCFYNIMWNTMHSAMYDNYSIQEAI